MNKLVQEAADREINTAWLLLQTTGKNLRRAYMKLYAAYL